MPENGCFPVEKISSTDVNGFVVSVAYSSEAQSLGIPCMPAGPERNTQQLIRDEREGSDAAFRELVRGSMRQVYDVAYSILNDHDEAEDIAQEAFVKVHTAIHSFRGESEFSTWLYRIGSNLSLIRLKQRKRKTKREVDLSHTEAASHLKSQSRP